MSGQYIQQHHDNGIDIYQFKAVTRAAIDEFYAIAMPIFKAHIDEYQDRVPLFYVFDLSKSGMFPVKYMMHKALEEISAYKYQPKHYIAYMITNTQDKMLVNILEQLSTRNLAHTRKVYKPEQLAEAITWLQDTRATFVSLS